LLSVKERKNYNELQHYLVTNCFVLAHRQDLISRIMVWNNFISHDAIEGESTEIKS